MILTEESASVARTLASILMARREGSRVIVVHDDFRITEQDYIFGPERMFEQLNALTLNGATYSHTNRSIRLRNGSECRYMIVQREAHADSFMGLECQMLVFDRFIRVPDSVKKIIGARCHRGGIKEDELMALKDKA